MKILIITHYFPPLNSVASLRPLAWAKFWSRMWHETAVITTKKHSFDGYLNLLTNSNDLNNVKVIEVPYWPFTGNENTVTPDNNSLTDTQPSPLVISIKERVRTLRKTIGSLGDIHDFLGLSCIKTAQNLYNAWKI